MARASGWPRSMAGVAGGGGASLYGALRVKHSSPALQSDVSSHQRVRTVMQAWRSEGSSPLAVRVSRRELVFGGSRGARTMMQPCASAAKLRGGGPIPHRGSAAMLALGSPPPRTVIGDLPRGRGGAPKLVARECV